MNRPHTPAYKSRADRRAAGEWLTKLANGVFKYGSERINTEGGFIVPDVMATAIAELRDKIGTFRQYANVIQMSSDLVRVPKRSGGQTAYYIDENSAITETQTAWDSVSLSPKKLASIIRVSNELMEDAEWAVEWLTQEFAYNLEAAVEKAGWAADGTSTYKGMQGFSTALLTYGSAGKVTAAAGHDTWAEYDLSDFATVMAKLPARFHDNASWFIHPRGYGAAMKRLDGAGVGDNLTFMGYPVVLTSALVGTDTGTDHTGLVVCGFGDPYYAVMLGERATVEVMRSDSRYMEFDQVGFKATSRFDISWHGLDDTTDLSGAVQGGAMVGLVGGA